MADHKLDIFKTLRAMDNRDYGYWDRLTPEERKGFAAPVVLRWMSSVSGDPMAEAQYIYMVNEMANVDYWSIHQHPELQMKLMTAAGIGAKQNHVWISMATQSTEGRIAGPLEAFMIKHWPQASNLEHEILLKEFTYDEFVDFVMFAGLSPADEDATLESYDRYTGKAKKRKASKRSKD